MTSKAFMDISTTIMEWLAIVLAALFLIYVIFTKRSVAISTPANGTGPIEGDLFYFLPIANLTAKATVKIEVTKNKDDDTIISSRPIDLFFENTVQIVADTGNMFA